MESKKISLFEISEEQKSIINIIEEFDGELTPEIEKALMINKQNRDQKVMAYVSVFNNSDALISTAQELKKRCETVIKREKTKQERMKSSLISYLTTFGEFSIGVMKFGIRKSSAVIVEDVNRLDKEYKTITVTEAADKKAIGKALKEGVEIEGCYIQENLNLKIN